MYDNIEIQCTNCGCRYMYIENEVFCRNIAPCKGFGYNLSEIYRCKFCRRLMKIEREFKIGIVDGKEVRNEDE